MERHIYLPFAVANRRPGKVILTCNECEKRWYFEIESTEDANSTPDPQTEFTLRCGHTIKFKWDAARETVRAGRVISSKTRPDGINDPPIEPSDTSEEVQQRFHDTFLSIAMRIAREGK